MTDTENRANSEADTRLLHRMVFFSDAVFAIVMTLLVLELRPPPATSEAALEAGLIALATTFIAFLTTFALTGVFWFAHMSTTRRLVVFDPLVAVANMAFLLIVSLMPFASRLLGENFRSPLIWEVYSLTLIAASVVNLLLLAAVNRGGGRLVGGPGGREVAYRALRAAAPGIAFTIGFWGASEGRMVIPQMCWVIIPLVFVIARLIRGRPAKQGAAAAVETAAGTEPGVAAS